MASKLPQKYVSPDPEKATPLNEMQRMFVDLYVHQRLTAPAAARQAGYASSHVTAYQMLKKPKIIAAVAAAREEYAKAAQISRNDVIEGFKEAIAAARLKSDAIGMVAGWREIGKMCGLYEPQKVSVDVTVKGNVMLTALMAKTDAELLELSTQTFDALPPPDESIIEGEISPDSDDDDN